MFEPIGGSAPKYGQGVINPLAAICAMQMMFATLGEEKAADAVEKAVMYVTANKLKSLAPGRMGYSTSQVGDLYPNSSHRNLADLHGFTPIGYPCRSVKIRH